jgi:hypothetical protein
MTLKIQCGCGAKYAFDATPEHMRTGVRLVCQSCGADNSEAVTGILQQQLAHIGILETAPRPVLEAIPIGVTEVPEAPPATVRAAPTTPAGICLKHPGHSYAAQCLVCQKPLCEKCLEMSGYVCSPLCKAKAESMRLAVPEYAGERVAVERKYWGRVKLAVWSAAALVTLLLGAWGWYSFVGSHPRVAWSVKFPPSDYGGYCKLVTPTQLLVSHGDRLARYDVELRREVWSTALLDKTQLARQATNWLARHGQYADVMLGKRDPWDRAARRQKVDTSEVVEGLRAGLAREIKVRVIGESIWVLFPDRLAQFDWASGKSGVTIPIHDRLGRFETSHDALFIVTTDDLGRENLTRVDARQGAVTEERIPIIPAPKGAKAPSRGGEADVFVEPFRTELVNAKRNFVLMAVALVEARIARHRAMEEPGKSALDGDVNAASSAAVANEMMNEWQRERTGGMRFEDESRYAITLKRLLGDAAADWTGEVTGRPAFHALDNVDIVAAGKTIHVFDKGNKRLWQSALGFSMAQQSAYNRDPYAEDAEIVPAVERGERLYFFDPGVLTCFELASGKVLWRLQAVGISTVQFDPQGTLYVTATSAGVDTLRHSQQVDITRTVSPLILKVDPSNGKILWDVPRRAQACRFTGKFIYAIEASMGEGGGSLTRRPVPEHMRISRLEPDSGRALWEHYDKRMPLSWDCAGQTIPILFRDELRILRFLSL